MLVGVRCGQCFQCTPAGGVQPGAGAAAVKQRAAGVHRAAALPCRGRQHHPTGLRRLHELPVAPGKVAQHEISARKAQRSKFCHRISPLATPPVSAVMPILSDARLWKTQDTTQRWQSDLYDALGARRLWAAHLST